MSGAVAHHPLWPRCTRDYWRTEEGCDEAQRAVEHAVEEWLALLPAALHATEEWTPLFWRMGLSSVLWGVISVVFDRSSDAASMPEGAAAPRFQPADLCFNARDLDVALPENRALIEWIARTTSSADASAALARSVECFEGWQIDRPGNGRNTPGYVHGIAANVRRWFRPAEGFGEIAHYCSPLRDADVTRGLYARSGGRIRLLHCPDVSARLRYDGAARAQIAARLLSASADRGALTRLSIGPVIALLPTAFIEQRAELRSWVATQRLPRVLVSGLGFQRSPYFAALCDRACARGARMVGVQHGGYYGQTDPTAVERIEKRICDLYCTWGYRHQTRDRPLPVLRLHAMAIPARPARPFAARALLAYSGNDAGPTLLARLPHYRQQGEAVAALIQALRDARARTPVQFALRPHPREGHDAMPEIWARELPDAVIERPSGRSLLQHSDEHDLTIFNFPGATGFLELLHADRSAMIVCPPELCPLRPEARPAFARLQAVGLYHPDIESFVRALGDWASIGLAWWEAPERRAACAAFRREFALSDPQPLARWGDFLVDCADHLARGDSGQS